MRGIGFEEAIFFIFILCVCAGSDIGGYVVGKIVGGKKLIKISPKKTISGVFGSYFFSILILYIIYSTNFFGQILSGGIPPMKIIGGGSCLPHRFKFNINGFTEVLQ